jgi:hypothetical protein
MSERKNYLLNVNSVKAIAKQEPPAKRKRYSDGDSLYLIHDPKGSLYWVMTYRYKSDKDIKPKQKSFHIGTYRSSKQELDTVFKPEVTLKQARLERDRAKDLLSKGIDPSVHKNKDKVSVEQKDLFNVIAQSYINEKSNTTPKNIQKLQTYLDKHVAPLTPAVKSVQLNLGDFNYAA